MTDFVSLISKRARGRSLSDFKGLTWAERKLLACVARGIDCHLGNNTPTKAERANTIRPDLIRFLALGGDENAPIHENGIKIFGSFIGDKASTGLYFEGAKIAVSLWFWDCFFDAPIVFRNARAHGIYFTGCTITGFVGDGLKLESDLLLQKVHSVPRYV